MEAIVLQLASKSKRVIAPDAVRLIASVSRFNPRVANNIFQRVLDFTIDAKSAAVTRQITIKTLAAMGIYRNGLEDIHIEYLTILATTFVRGWASLGNLCALMQEERKSLEANVEVDLIELGYLEKSSRGRKITNAGKKYLTTYNFHNPQLTEA